ncbi:hypothetical protein I79_023082 [Cricetulus griseus]|uniref:Uncharacterized protein n=1 Tax=Cricetulus griseus TaxID=10029 RepID=G3IH04_CRIGR|nr:hypothetical protein I79_023082 [Cricetulus griseus]
MEQAVLGGQGRGWASTACPMSTFPVSESPISILEKRHPYKQIFAIKSNEWYFPQWTSHVQMPWYEMNSG